MSILDELTIKLPEEVVLFPYESTEEEDWPRYVDDNGNKQPLPEAWRRVGFRLPYPTQDRLAILAKRQGTILYNDKGSSLEQTQPSKIAKYIANSLVKRLVEKLEGGLHEDMIPFGNKERGVLADNLAAFDYLLDTFILAYRNITKVTEENKKGEEDVFTMPLDSITND